MKNYVIATRVTAILSLISFSIAVIIQYFCCGIKAEFWCNVCLGIFGSSLLTFITSIIGYFTDKRKTMESFLYSTYSLLNIIKQYDINWSLENKIDFYLNYLNIDKSIWDSQFGAIYFMFDINDKNLKYIFNNIYKPIFDFNQAISKHEYHFRWHKDGSGSNAAVMEVFISELENLFIKRVNSEYSRNSGEKTSVVVIKNQLVNTVMEELNGRYYELMYNKRNERGDK
jgi:hypothetical protein